MLGKRGFTTMTDLDRFRATTWTFLTNITMQWQYDGIACAFREKGIALYGIDLGTTRANHPFIGLLVPPQKDKNYGVNIYVPVDRLAEAYVIAKNEDVLRTLAGRESEVGPGEYAKFYEEVSKARKNARKDHKGTNAFWRGHVTAH